MISYLKGTIIYKGNCFAILETNGIGFQVFLPEPYLLEKKTGETIEIFSHEYLREDSRELYGFATVEELKFFWQLIDISGVGPRMAHKIISAYNLEKIKESISLGDLGVLASISGVGKKTAQKILLELKGKLVDGETPPVEDEITEALVRLGCSRNEAREAVGRVGKNIEGTEEKIKAALKNLGK